MLLLAGIALAAPLESTMDVRTHLMAALEQRPENGCLTPLVHELNQHWQELTVEERARATAVLAPSRTDLFAPFPPRKGPPPPPAAKDSCEGQQMNNRVTGAHFVVEWDAGITEATANRFLEALELSYEVEVEEMGWEPPVGDGEFLLPAYVENRDTNGAYTYVTNCDNKYMPYISAGRNSWQNADWGDIMASHEFNHTLQFAYSFAPELWWWEATATWIEAYVYPSINQWAWYVTGYSDYPYVAFDASSQEDEVVFYHMYGMALWSFYLDEYHGGPDTIREIWENASRARGNDAIDIDDMMKDIDIDWEDAFVDFSARNTVMDYAHHEVIPEVRLTDTVTTLPAEGESARSTKPEGHGQNYIKFGKGLGDGTLTIDFTGDPGADWSVQLVEASRSAVERSVVQHIEGGEGTISMQDVGNKDVFLVVSPLEDSENGYSYSWSASLDTSGATGDTGATQDTGRADGDSDENKISIGQSCACASGSEVPTSALLFGALAGVLGARRRRT